MAQWVNRLRNNIFVNAPPLPLFCEISGALHQAQPGLTAGCVFCADKTCFTDSVTYCDIWLCTVYRHYRRFDISVDNTDRNNHDSHDIAMYFHHNNHISEFKYCPSNNYYYIV